MVDPARPSEPWPLSAVVAAFLKAVLQVIGMAIGPRRASGRWTPQRQGDAPGDEAEAEIEDRRDDRAEHEESYP